MMFDFERITHESEVICYQRREAIDEFTISRLNYLKLHQIQNDT